VQCQYLPVNAESTYVRAVSYGGSGYEILACGNTRVSSGRRTVLPTTKGRGITCTHERKPTMAANSEPSGAQKMFGDFAPGLVHLTDVVLFGEVWERTELSPRDRSLVTVACLTTNGNTEQLVFHLDLARRNGCTEEELKEALTHLAFYAGWPQAIAAMAVAKKVFSQ
jgi:4-carboxymuconolactone decarboxylase